MRKREPEILWIHETALDSLVSDLGTATAVIVVIGTGWLLGSTAMQWAGFGLLVVSAIAFALKRDRRMTIAQARAKLDELEKNS